MIISIIQQSQIWKLVISYILIVVLIVEPLYWEHIVLIINILFWCMILTTIYIVYH